MIEENIQNPPRASTWQQDFQNTVLGTIRKMILRKMKTYSAVYSPMSSRAETCSAVVSLVICNSKTVIHKTNIQDGLNLNRCVKQMLDCGA